jgi:hypothetical protein
MLAGMKSSTSGKDDDRSLLPLRKPCLALPPAARAVARFSSRAFLIASAMADEARAVGAALGLAAAALVMIGFLDIPLTAVALSASRAAFIKPREAIAAATVTRPSLQ